MSIEQWLVVFMSGLAATMGTFIGVAIQKKIARRDCSDCGPMNAVLTVLTALVTYNSEIPVKEKIALQEKLSVPGR